MNGLSHNFISSGKQILAGLKQVKTIRLSSLRKVFSLMGKKEKIAVLALLAVALASLFLSTANIYYAKTIPAPAFGGSFSEGLLGQPTYINPLLAHDDTDKFLTKLIYSGLYKLNNSGQLVPDLADGLPKISEDQKQYTIHLRRDVKWHNDKLFTADDVIFTIQTLKDPAFKSPERGLWLSTNVEKLSDFSVKFTTKEVSSPFLHNLTLPVLPKNPWNRVGPQNFLLTKYNIEAVGTGPYALKEIKKLASGKIQQITLESFSNYYGGKPKLSQLVFKFYDSETDMLNAFHSGEILGVGFIPLDSSLYLEETQTEARIYNIPLPHYQTAFFNLDNRYLADQKVRQALSAATDKKKIIEAVFKNKAFLPASPLLPPENPSPDFLPPNAQIAAQILDSGGWTVNPTTNLRTKNNNTLEFTITTNDYILNSKAAEMLAEQWRALNIKVNLSLLPTKQLSEEIIKPRRFDVLLYPQKFSADPDPFQFWHSSQANDPGANLSGLTHPTVDRLTTEARTTTKTQAKLDKYAELDKILDDKVPFILLDQSLYVYAIDKSVNNIGLRVLFDPSQRAYDIPNWYMNEQRVWK